MPGEKRKKKDLRKEILKRLDSCSEEELREKSRIIIEKLLSLPLYKNSSFFMTYVSFAKEVDTFSLIERSLNLGKRVAVPYIVSVEGEMVPAIVKSLQDLEPGPWGILQPKKEKLEVIQPQKLDFLIVPGVAFDRKGNRLGRGKGFYDRFLSHLPPSLPRISLVYSFQIVEEIPVDKHDLPVNLIITEKEIIEVSDKFRA